MTRSCWQSIKLAFKDFGKLLKWEKIHCGIWFISSPNQRTLTQPIISETTSDRPLPGHSADIPSIPSPTLLLCKGADLMSFFREYFQRIPQKKSEPERALQMQSTPMSQKITRWEQTSIQWISIRSTHFPKTNVAYTSTMERHLPT